MLFCFGAFGYGANRVGDRAVLLLMVVVSSGKGSSKRALGTIFSVLTRDRKKKRGKGRKAELRKRR